MIARALVCALTIASAAAPTAGQAQPPDESSASAVQPPPPGPAALPARLARFKTRITKLETGCGAACDVEALVLTAGAGKDCLANVVLASFELPEGVRHGMLTWVDVEEPGARQAARVPAALVQPAGSPVSGVSTLCLPSREETPEWALGLRLAFPSDAALGQASRLQEALANSGELQASRPAMGARAGGIRRIFGPDSFGWLRALITSDPPGAIVMLDGAPVGVHTNGTLRLAPGALGRLRLRSRATEVSVKQCEHRLRPSIELDVEILCRFSGTPTKK